MLWLIATPELQKVRKSRKFTQRQVVEILNAATRKKYSTSFYSRVEHQIHPVNLETGVEIAKLFEKGVDDLFINKELFTGREVFDDAAED